MESGEPTVDQVTVAVEELLPQAYPVRPVAALRRGRSHTSWILDSGLGPLVGKVLLTGRRNLMLDRLAEHRRVWEHGVPVPRILGCAPSSRAVGDRLLVVFKYVPGQDAEEASHSLSANVMVEAMRDAGAAVARLHQVPTMTFGDPVTGLGVGPDTWSAAVTSRVELLDRVYREMDSEWDNETAGIVFAGLALLGCLADDVSPAVQPAVAHLDIYLPNVLVDDEGRFQLLLDLEHVRWVDPVMDFVKPAMWIFEERPGWAEAFVDGYQAVGGWPQRWSERLAVTTGLELLMGVNYWARVNDQPMYLNYLSRLRIWVRSDGVDHVWPSPVP